MNGLRLAISFLTVLPVTPRKVDSNMASASAYFPLVGLMLGGVLVGVDLALRQVFPLALTGAMLVAVPVLLTRALHVDGFMDACDGLLGGYTRERRLEIFPRPAPGRVRRHWGRHADARQVDGCDRPAALHPPGGSGALSMHISLVYTAGSGAFPIRQSEGDGIILSSRPADATSCRRGPSQPLWPVSCWLGHSGSC